RTRMRRLVRAWFFLSSFLRRSWTLDDYPVSVRRQEGDAPPFAATIDGMFLAGLGATPEAARAELAARLKEYRASHDSLPRPGTQAPIRYASTTRIVAHGALRDEFVERILRMEPGSVFISDESRLGEFPEEIAEYGRRIMLLYGVDIDTLADEKFATILDAIADRPARGGRV
nr:hypothetical protein [Candidatus Eremiobacteraeota bacterium]